MLVELHQQPSIAGIQTSVIDPMQAQGFCHQRLINGRLASPHGGHITHATQQTVGDPGRTTATASDPSTGCWRQGNTEQISGSGDDRLQVLLAVELKPLDQAEPIPQRGTEGTRPGCGTDQGERGQIEGAGPCRAAFANGEIQPAVLHRRVEQLLSHAIEAMNLVDEQEFPGLQIHQQADDVPGTFEGRSTGDPAAHPQLFGQHERHGGLTETGRAVQQDVIEGFIPAQRRLNRDAENLFQLGLPDVIRQTFGPKTVIGTGLHLFSRRLHIQHPFRTGRWGAGVGGNDRHAGRVPSPG